MGEPAEKYVEISKPTKTLPPLRNLSSFLVNATVFSYYGTQSQVGILLNSLSKNSRAYAERHLSLLKVFLNWEAEISYSLEFGDTTAKYQVHDRPHPTDKALKELTRTKVIKLQRIRYKTSKIGTLGGIQLEFANMTGSAFY